MLHPGLETDMGLIRICICFGPNLCDLYLVANMDHSTPHDLYLQADMDHWASAWG